MTSTCVNEPKTRLNLVNICIHDWWRENVERIVSWMRPETSIHNRQGHIITFYHNMRYYQKVPKLYCSTEMHSQLTLIPCLASQSANMINAIYLWWNRSVILTMVDKFEHCISITFCMKLRKSAIFKMLPQAFDKHLF